MNLYGRFDRQFLKRLMSDGGMSRWLMNEQLRDRDGCTPLLCAVKRNADANGDTPLHHAVNDGSAPIANSLLMVKLLLCFGADLDVRNNSGQTPDGVPYIDEKIATVLRRAKTWSQRKGASELSKAKTKKIHKAALARVRREQQRLAMDYQRERAAKDKGRGDALRLLSLDGGGIRGLVIIQILLELERMADGGGNTQNKEKKKYNFLRRHFDFVAGTSTGAILALALADGTPLVDCLRLYLKLKDDVFGPEAKESRFGGYKPEHLEKFLQDHFGKERKMSDIRCGKMKVFATATDARKIPVQLVLFRNYYSPFVASTEHSHESVCVWTAARCSSAAPTYFSNVGGLIDGGIYANNPSNELLNEIHLHNKWAKMNKEQPEKDINFMLSIGTGKMPPRDVDNIDVTFQPTVSSLVRSLDAFNNLKTIMLNQVTNSDGPAVELARTFCHDKKIPFFRITPQLKSEIKLDTTDNTKIIKMMWKAKAFVSEWAEGVADLVDLLRATENDE
ncbi:hypothetical protein niasHT_011086 [Heterodera trifolii]|uniref:phospholipase A2 n=1 Tax=Heterodera trifolii TaxID=157864 RepID=A0ABD2L9J2_9BILA